MFEQRLMPRQFPGAFIMGERGIRFRYKRSPCLGQLNLARVPIEELDPKLLLEQSPSSRQRRNGSAEFFGSSHKAGFLNKDDDEYLAFKGESAQHGTPTFSTGLSEKQGTPGRLLRSAVFMRRQRKREKNRA
jgi:hypothetical protein